MLTTPSVYVNLAALLCVLLAVPFHGDRRQRKILSRNLRFGTLLLGLVMLIHGGYQTIMRSSPHDQFNGYVSGWTGGWNDTDSSLWIYDYGYPPPAKGTVPGAPYRNLHLARHKHPVPKQFWEMGNGLYVKCEYRRWDQQITHIEAYPTAAGRQAGLTGWDWDSDSEGRSGWILETLLGLIVLLRLARTSLPPALRTLDVFPGKWPIRIFASAAILLLAYCGAVRVSDRFFQYRAESCLRDIRALEPGKSTWQDAERIHAKYAKWATTKKPCSSARCDLTITFDHWVGSMNSGRKLRELAGGRSARVWAAVRTRGGTVWGTDFALVVPDREGYEQYASAETLRNFGGFMLWGRRGSVRLHPNLLASSHKFQRAYLTPYASTVERRDAFAFNLACIGGTLRPCSNPSQLLPLVATRNSQPDEFLAYEKEQGDFVWTPTDMLRPNGRDAQNIAIVEVSQIFPKQRNSTGYESQRVNYQVIEVLKGAFKDLSQPATYYLTGAPSPGSTIPGPPALHQRLIAFWGEGGNEQNPTIAPISEQNLQQVRVGIAEDQVDIPAHP